MKKLIVTAIVLLMALTGCAAVKSTASEPPDQDNHTEVLVIQEVFEEAPPVPCPVTEDEIVMLAKTMNAESQVLYWNGTKYGVSYIARQAAVGWCALNRLDEGTFGDTLGTILSKPYQFAYTPDAELTEHFVWLAKDVVDRWWSEKQGNSESGRTLPSDYLFFEGDGRENHFRKEYEHTGETWDWSLPDPYAEVQ